MIPILIPSRGRANDVRTIQQFPLDLQEVTNIFVPPDEYVHYARALSSTPVIVRGLEYSSIGDKRHKMAQWAANSYSEMFLMVDDDVIWARRRNHEETGLQPMVPDDFQPMLHFAYSQMVGNVAVVGISAREGNNRMGYGKPEALIEPNTRVFRAALFKTQPFLSVEHNRLPFMEDFDVLLQLLKRGHENRCLYYWAQDQRGTQTQGGCSTTRTLELHNKSAEGLAQLHPGIVTLREKSNKTGGSFGKRTEVTIAWKKALLLSGGPEVLLDDSELAG